MMRQVVKIMLLMLVTGCRSQSGNIVIYSKDEIVPQLFIQHDGLQPSADYFVAVFEKAFGEKLKITEKPSNEGTTISLGLLPENTKNDFFRITSDSKSVKIEGADAASLKNGINYFLRKYGGVRYISGKGIVPSKNKSITVPQNLSYVPNYDFGYREPYFPDNYDVEFRNFYETHSMEDTWAMWGHNLSTLIQPSAQMMAKVDGKVNEEQFCFSSPELEQALTGYIKNQAIDDPLRTKYMILANDNAIVCQCDKCRAAGNTKSNAGPAVFSLLNRIAGKFPKQEFYTAAYMTTHQAPDFKFADNAGIMISTMAFPKGVILEQSSKKTVIDKMFADWRKVTEKILLWDYAINFDNYFKAYPTVLITQQNLKYYKKMGVKGVFMQGSEGDYSSYADLKNYLYALLLQDTETDIKKEIVAFFKAKYPSLADLLAEYYVSIEEKSFDNKGLLDIYGGMVQSKKKYLDENALNAFGDALFKEAKKVSKNEYNDLKPLLLSITFIRLELLRTNGIGTKGYKKSPDVEVDKNIEKLLKTLKQLSSETGIKKYNEPGLLIDDYIEEWNREIISKPYQNLLFGKTIKLVSEPDEGYEDALMLTDGAIGFSDYYNNWMLCTKNDLEVETDTNGLEGQKTLEITFLQDIRHNIYLPEKVEIWLGSRKFERAIDTNDATEVIKRTVKIPIDIKETDKKLRIKIVKHPEYKVKSVAVDEVFIKKE